MSADSVRKLDARILELSKYESSRGGTRRPSREQISGNFRYFKGLIMKLEATIDELDDLVRSRYGDPASSNMTLADFGFRETLDSDLALMPACEVLSTELFPA